MMRLINSFVEIIIKYNHSIDGEGFEGVKHC